MGRTSTKKKIEKVLFSSKTTQNIDTEEEKKSQWNHKLALDDVTNNGNNVANIGNIGKP